MGLQAGWKILPRQPPHPCQPEIHPSGIYKNKLSSTRKLSCNTSSACSSQISLPSREDATCFPVFLTPCNLTRHSYGLHVPRQVPSSEPEVPWRSGTRDTAGQITRRRFRPRHKEISIHFRFRWHIRHLPE